MARFTLYSEKTVSQCLSALNGRMQAKETATRPALGGWIERGGDFALHVTQPAFGKFVRTTRLNGHIERQSGITVIKGTVSFGSSPRERAVALGVLAMLGLVIAVGGQPLLALLLIPVGLWMYIPMVGDYTNGPLLLSEVQRALKAKTAPPRPARATGASKASASARDTQRPASKPARSASKPAPRPVAKPATPPARSYLEPDKDDAADEDAPPPVNEDVQPRLM